jgi:DDE superfamily endonuclease
MAITQADAVIASNFDIECLLEGEDYGNSVEFRRPLADRGLLYAIGASKATKVFAGDRMLAAPKHGPMARPRSRAALTTRPLRPLSLEQLAKSMLGSTLQRIVCRNGTKGPLAAKFLILRAISAHRWRSGQRHGQVWLIWERTLGRLSARKRCLPKQPASIGSKQFVATTRECWAIEER